MKVLKSFGFFVLFGLLAILLASGCGESLESIADGDGNNGEGPDGGDVGVGEACASTADCVADSFCIPAGDELICTPTCTSDAECQQIFFNGCCIRIGTAHYCAPSTACNAADGDDATPDGDKTPDGDTAPGCTPDTYECETNAKIRRCNTAGEWTAYKTCQEGTFCVGGSCITGGDGCIPSEGDECCPGTYRCRGMGEIQACRVVGEHYIWDFYRACDTTEMCLDGVCERTVQPDGDAADGDGDSSADGDDDPVGEPCTISEGCLDPNEYCLPDEIDGTEGHCTCYCDQGCRCPRGWTCEDATCQPIEGYCKSDSQCEMDEFCDRNPNTGDGLCQRYCYEMGEYCPNGYYCDENFNSPNYGKCVYDSLCEGCDYDQMCDSTQYCEVPPGQIQGCCIDKCSSSNDCPGGQICDKGKCRPGNPTPDCGGPCPAGHVCDAVYGMCVLNCKPCGKDECCDSGSSPNCYVCVCENPLICGFGLRACCFGSSCSAIVYGVYGFCI